MINSNSPKFKPLDLSDLKLNPKRIDIWQYSLNNAWDKIEDLLNDEEIIRAERYHFARHKRRFTVARAMLRIILAKYVSAANPANLCFNENKYGKPSLINPNNIQFNLSHSKDLALLAIGKDFPLGIDLEYFSARPYQGIAEQMFSNKEINALKEQSNLLKPLTFFHTWAQKEAFIKACGLGLSYPTKSFDVFHGCPNDEIIIDKTNNTKWRMISFMPKIACSAALCHNPLIKEIRYKII